MYRIRLRLRIEHLRWRLNNARDEQERLRLSQRLDRLIVDYMRGGAA